jgi:histone H3/H4
MKKTVEYAVSKASKTIQPKDADKVIESFVMAIQHTFRQEMERLDRSKTV